MIFEVLITSSVLILGILGLRKLTMGRISMRLRYGLWLLVALRLLMPLSLGTSPLSVMNLFSAIRQEDAFQGGTFSGQGGAAQEEPSHAAQTMKADGNNTLLLLQNPAQEAGGQDKNITPVTDELQDGTPAAAAKEKISYGRTPLTLGIAVVWIMGFLAVGGYLFFQRFRFVRYLRGNRRALSGQEIPAPMSEKLSGRGMEVYRVKGLPSPCLVGKHIYIGERTPQGEQEMRHVLAHEYCHRMHGDGFWAFLRCALVTVYWFDPLVWAAAFAARQDSDLACDEAAVRLLGEEERFAYGRTLLSLLRESGGGAECPGMPLLFSGGERGVRERIVSLAGHGKAEAVVLAAVLSLVILLSGCAFTGAGTDEAASSEAEGGQETEVSQDGENGQETAAPEKQKGNGDSETVRQQVLEESNRAFAQIQAEYEETLEAKQAAFEEVLNYGGVMAGRDDSELSLDREVDAQHFYEYRAGVREDAPEEGWYLLCRAQEEPISLYGLYTEEFGCRGMKIRIGEDVNTFDRSWFHAYPNGDSKNIRVLERARDGLPRRFVWQYVEEESYGCEIWRLGGGFRYDTGTVELEILPKEDYLSWADRHLSWQIDPEWQQVRIFYDGDEDVYVGALDISAYAGLPVEEAGMGQKTVDFELDSGAFEGEECIALYLTVGLKLEGSEEVFIDGLHPLAVPVFFREGGDTGFRFGQPKVDERYVMHSTEQQRLLEELREEAGEEGATDTGTAPEGEDHLSVPLVNSGDGHHDLLISFRNPCPDYDRISNPYGARTHPLTGEVKVHHGVDLAAQKGADVVAAAEGTVYATGFDAENGNYVVLWHGDSGQMTYYAHCQDILVSQGDAVAAGEKIATVGQTGRATGACLHFAVSYEGEWQEPEFSDGEG